VLPIGIGDAGVVEDVSPAELEAAVVYMLGRARMPGSKGARERGSKEAKH
jgi:hypothetical protein